MIKNILVTGAAGALGSLLVRKFVDDHKVIGLDVKRIEETKLNNVNCEYKWKAVEDMTKDDIEDIDVIFHAAAQADRPLGISSPLYTNKANTDPLIHLLEVIKNKDIHLIYCGSGTTFTGVPPDEQPITEETIPKPTNIYSATKYIDEVLCNTHRRAFDTPITILRSGCVFGPGGRSDISIMRYIKRALNDKTIYVRSPEATRTFTYIENVGQYYDALLDSPRDQIVGEIFHTVTIGTELKIIELANKVIDILDSDSDIVEQGYEDGELINGEPVRQCIISTKDDVLGISPSISFEEGVKGTAKWVNQIESS